MKSHPIFVTDTDMDRLRRLAQALRYSLFRDQRQLELLEQTLDGAEVTSSERIPASVIRMNSRVRVLDFDTEKRGLYTLVFPENADISKGLISVLAPLGIAFLGHKQGDVIEAKVPGGIRRLRVERVLSGPEITGQRVLPDRSNRRKVYLSRRSQKIRLAA